LFGTVAASALNAFGRKQPLTWRDIFSLPEEAEPTRIRTPEEILAEFRKAHSLIGTN